MAVTDRAVTPPPHVAVPTRGPLRVDRRNPRYFADATGTPLLLAGSHTWATLQEAGPSDPPKPFDWPRWLAFMREHGHNFMRLWTWENAKWGSWFDGDYFFEPLPWARTGPGVARDGKPKFDLTRFDERWFDRLRTRSVDSRDNGIYIAIMLFQGWSAGNKPFDDWSHENPVRQGPNPWHGHPFNGENNINGIDASAPGGEGDGWVHTLRVPEALALQEAYVRRVIDTVNDLDNVMYEIGNEHDGTPANTAWQYHVANVVREYQETAKPQVHPVFMTSQYPGPDTRMLFSSSAEAVSPFRWHGDGSYHWQTDPPAQYLGKVVVADTDHLWGVGGTADWVWKTFARGHNILYMDTWGYDHFELRGPQPDEGARRAMGRALELSRTIDLGAAIPRPELASTGYALVDPGRRYIVYQPDGPRVLVDLTGAEGMLQCTWLHPVDPTAQPAPDVEAGGVVQLLAPSDDAWVVDLSHT